MNSFLEYKKNLNKNFTLRLLTFVFLSLMISNSYAKHKDGKTYNNLKVYKLGYIYDGDTFRVDIKNCLPLLCENIRIRIYGIDAPEIKGRCKKEKRKAKKARDSLRKLLKKSKKIILKNPRRGNYFRIVADVYADNINVAKYLLKKRLVSNKVGKKKNWCK